MDRLPPELVIHILESLDQTDLRSASAASRLFYASAWSAGRYLHRSIRWCDTGSRATGHEIVPHARKKGLRLSLSIDLQGAGGGDAAATKVPVLVDVALPVLVYLAVWVSETLLPSLSTILRHPAPDIGYLRLCVRIQTDSVPLYNLPMDLFAGSAPKLRFLELLDIAFGSDLIPALTTPHSVTVSYTEIFPYIDFGHHFPRMRNLDVRYVSGNTDVPPHLAAFKLDGVRLRWLFVQDYEPYTMMATIMRLIDVAAIPSVVHTSEEINWAEPFWQREYDVPLSVRLARCVREDGDINVRVVPAHRRWRREYNMFWTLANEFPIMRLPGVSERLVYMRLENRLRTALRNRTRASLDQLRVVGSVRHFGTSTFSTDPI